MVPGFASVSVSGGGGSVAAGVITSDFLLRLPLNDFWPTVHLAAILLDCLRWYYACSGGSGNSVQSQATQ